jgi:hypothetical protein
MRAVGFIILFLCSLAGVENVNSAALAALSPPNTPILFQPLFIWQAYAPSRQGTGFFARAPDGRVVAVTSAHLVDPQGPALLEARWLDLRTGNPVAVLTRSWGPPGKGGTDTPTSDLRSDYLLLPVQVPIPPDQVLELDPRPTPEIQERVWFPNKDQSAPLGYRLVAGAVAAAAVKCLTVILDQPIALTSQSGSPIISQTTGRVIGTLSRGGRERGRTVLLLTPAAALLKALTGHQAIPLLRQVIGR